MVERAGHLGKPIGSRVVSGVGDADEPAKPTDDIRNAGVIRSHNDAVENLTGCCAAIDVLDERFTGEFGESLTRKTTRLIASGDDGERSVVR
jgi:hypothetical protein